MLSTTATASLQARPRLGALLVLVLVLALAATACSSEPGAPTDAGVDAPRRDTGLTEMVVGPTDRPARLVLPDAYDGTTALPLVVLLHGYSAAAVIQDAYFGVTQAAESRGIYVLLPDGTVDSSGNHFWNATDACCDFGPTGVDDVGYLDGLLDDAIATVPVDTTRIYFVGHSNGAFMSYRMACEHSERIAAIAPLAGVDFLDPTRCVPTMPVSVLHWHGTLDDTILYGGAAGYPGAQATIDRWAGYASCDAPTTAPPVDVSSAVAGEETVVSEWSSGCTDGTTFTLWRIEGEGHIPGLQPETMGRILDWLLLHQR